MVAAPATSHQIYTPQCIGPSGGEEKPNNQRHGKTGEKSGPKIRQIFVFNRLSAQKLHMAHNSKKYYKLTFLQKIPQNIDFLLTFSLGFPIFFSHSIEQQFE